MKKILYSTLLVCGLLSFAGCEDITTEDTSKVTYFIDFNMAGDKVMNVVVGTGFTDPGVTAKEGTQDVTSSMVIEGTVNPNEVGAYKITYSAKNVDGFASSVTRLVYVYDPSAADLSGTYTVQGGSYRLTLSGGAQVPYAGYPITITKFLPGFYNISDFFGGYYEGYRGYGSDYAMTGSFALKVDNTIGYISSTNKGWSDSMDGVTGSYDPATGAFSLAATYAGSYTFNIIIKK
ncbi:MAG: DUF5012 domain-containing protein [Bacteroidales bacterium]|nr:DUF5012 domain-containing protein [Bacteroidales bacterium]MDD3906836.1 DUF5012 domain-containing protein [Bacteroidales bacterium]MDD4711778.1 DUF5012 domain-containing protein [Bacteroidales bacterium]